MNVRRAECRGRKTDGPGWSSTGRRHHYQTKSGPVHALDDVSLEVREGEFLCILGPSGCGKTTLLWSMAGLHELSGGEISLGGEPITKPHPADRDDLPGRQPPALAEPREEHRAALRAEAEAARPGSASSSFSSASASPASTTNIPRELSGGMQQRASIVRSLAVDPSVLLMDEPFGALDAFTRDEMNLLIQEIWMETGKTIAFVTHSIPEAIFLADRVVVMSARPGRIAAIYDVDIPRPRSVEIQTQPGFHRAGAGDQVAHRSSAAARGLDHSMIG